MNADDFARERCGKLLALARKFFPVEPALAKRYVRLARAIASRHRISLGNRAFCKKCGTVFIPGKTLRVRLSPSKKAVLYICLSCSNVRRIPYSRK